MLLSNSCHLCLSHIYNSLACGPSKLWITGLPDAVASSQASPFNLLIAFVTVDHPSWNVLFPLLLGHHSLLILLPLLWLNLLTLSRALLFHTSLIGCASCSPILDSSSVKELVAQLYPTLCNPKDGSPTGSSAHGILQAIILEWVAIPFSRGSSWPRNRTQVSCIEGRFFTDI